MWKWELASQGEEPERIVFQSPQLSEFYMKLSAGRHMCCVTILVTHVYRLSVFYPEHFAARLCSEYL